MTTIDNWLLKLGEGDLHDQPPGSTQRLEFGDPDDDGLPANIATTYNNDGFELWLGYRWKWHVFYRGKEARQLAWFILWTWWAKGTWFGLKRKLWYGALRRKINRWPKPQAPHIPEREL